MKFLAIDTSGKHLTVLAYRDGVVEKSFSVDCAMQHSVRLLDEVDKVLDKAQMKPSDCDFFAVVVGPGSFTGIRIGIATVKGLATATDKKVLPVTSLDVVAYTTSEAVTATVDAGHGYVYSADYENKKLISTPSYIARESLTGTLLAPEKVDVSEGLLSAVLDKKRELVSPEELFAFYLRKSSAEEARK